MGFWTILRFVLAVFMVHLLVSTDLAEGRKRKLKFCKIDNMMECFNEPVAYFTSQENGTGVPRTEEEFEQYCFNTHDYLPYCVGKWMKRCGSEMHAEIARRFVFEPMQQSLRKFCDTKGTVRPTFLKHAMCLINTIKLLPAYRMECVRTTQANQEYIHDLQLKSPNISAFIGSFCCAYNEWENCIVGFLRKNCGEESTYSTIPSLIHHTTMFIIRDICPLSRFDPTDPTKCLPEQYLAPKDYVPKGLASESIVSHFFSYLCPNIGWGVVLDRDF